MKDETKYIIDKSIKITNVISVGITWLDGRIVFKHTNKYSKFWYGICHFSEGIFAVTPLDYDIPTMLTTIKVAPPEKYCERAYSCLNTECKLNRFNRAVFLSEFKDVGEFSLGIPRNFVQKGFWANQGKWKKYWSKFIIPIVGGVLRYDEKKGEELGIGD